MRALILVDIQNDFLLGGALAVPSGDDVIAIANRVIPTFDLVVATQDWHPPDHGSFAANHEGKTPGEVIELDALSQILWPTHCVQGSAGAEFAAGFNLPDDVHVFQKGTELTIDSYSGFFDNGHRKATGLGDFLNGRGVTDVFVMGLATDYCVKFTAIDAVDLGFNTTLIEDGCRGVNLQPNDVANAIEEMRERGISIVDSVAIT